MADKDGTTSSEVDLDDDDSESEKSSEETPKTKKKAKNQPHIVTRAALGTAGLSMLLGFFLPWLQVGDDPISGLGLVFEGRVIAELFELGDVVNATHRYLLLIVPGCGLGLTIAGFMGFRWSGVVGTVAGFSVIGYGVFGILYIFVSKTGAGLWMVLGGSVFAFAIGLFATLRGRQGKAATGEDLSDARALGDARASGDARAEKRSRKASSKG